MSSQNTTIISDFKPKSAFINMIMERGHYYQSSDLEGLDKIALEAEQGKRELVGYIGYDCTAPSLHVGSLTQIMFQRRFQQCGGKPITLMGSGTTRIGDPSFKNEARPVLTLEKIEENKRGIQKVFDKLIDFSDGKALMVDNIEWLEKVSWLEMLSEIGRHFTVNKMISLEIVKRRLDDEIPITFLEFNYMLLQAYDFLELSRRYGCVLQMGGSDQWGNIIQGVELCRRVDNREVFGVTQPLLMNSAGQKMGKTVSGAVWLDGDMLPSFDFWQYWRNVDDADVGKLLRLFTELPLDEIKRLEELQGAEINEAKKILANEITALLHGRDAANSALQAAQAQFTSQGGDASGLPTVELEIDGELSIAALFVKAGLFASNSEAKKAAANNSVSIDDIKISDVTSPAAAIFEGKASVKLSSSKKKHIIVKKK
ncbi:tyrosine--tRNA ligase [Pseudaquidulcibacter saccharophilus]|uniref:tyrosine--tRNA ligase n=1 Tax=Pseudaquidulcibacter saccharophilus TaxID=2831900 RepID=UPI001EFEF1A7|nr:tyrosine--tRNA ligase [Pseudaquidulcibacter saccharophilus]